MSDAALVLAQELLARQSLTPNDAGCQQLLAERLQALGFEIEWLNFSDHHGDVTNLWARLGKTEPCFVFAGHTDVVPIGNIKDWDSDPFTPTIRGTNLYARGAADMKTSLAAFIVAIEEFLLEHPNPRGSIALLITSDEEGPATCGTKMVVETLMARNELIDYCLVGEPSSNKTLGDVIKPGRRGSISAALSIIGTQGHIAYPELADNPIHKIDRVINALTSIEWDSGSDYFPPSSLQISNIHGGTGAGNVIPANVDIHFNIRFSNLLTVSEMKSRIESELSSLDIEFEINWTVFGEPFLTQRGRLVDACVDAIEDTLGIKPSQSTGGGTSDGRFIAKTGAQVVELGPVNASIHKVNEHVALDTPHKLALIYQNILKRLLSA